MSGWGLEQVQTFCSVALPGVQVTAAKRLSGGFWNDVLRLETSRGRLILKRYGAVMPGTLFPNLPEMEALALQRLSGLDVAPDLLGFWPEDRVLIYTYVAGALWREDVAGMAALLRRKEAADPAGFRAVPMGAAAILAAGDVFFASCDAVEIVSGFLRLRPVAGDTAAPGRLSLIHTDIGAGNLVGAGAALRLIDWQCPAAGDLAEDVFSFLAPAFQVLNDRPPLTDAQRAEFFAALAMPALEVRLKTLEPAYAYRMAGYCCRRMQTADTAEVRATYTRAVLAELARMAVFA